MKPAFDFETQLNAVPVRNERLRVCETGGHADVLVVEVPLSYRGLTGAVARLARARSSKRYELAGVSRELFEQLDGRCTIEDLVEGLCERDRLTFLEGRALVLQYLRDLMQRGLVAVVSDGSPGRLDPSATGSVPSKP